MSQNDLIFHVAIDHKLIEKFIKELTIELKNFNHNKLETLVGKLEVIDLSVLCQSVI